MQNNMYKQQSEREKERERERERGGEEGVGFQTDKNWKLFVTYAQLRCTFNMYKVKHAFDVTICRHNALRKISNANFWIRSLVQGIFNSSYAILRYRSS